MVHSEKIGERSEVRQGKAKQKVVRVLKMQTRRWRERNK